MSRIIGVLAAAVVASAGTGCFGGLVPGVGGGGGGGAYKPAECYANQYTGDLSHAKVGRWVTYAMEAGGNKTSQTVRVVGKAGDGYMIEHWMDMGSMAYGFLFQVNGKKEITKAWAAAKDEESWTEITVKEPPKAQQGDAPEARLKESDENKAVKAGSFDSHRIQATVNVQGKDYTSVSWYSKDVPGIYISSEHGGLVAMEASGSQTSLEAKGEDAKPTIELPSE